MQAALPWPAMGQAGWLFIPADGRRNPIERRTGAAPPGLRGVQWGGRSSGSGAAQPREASGSHGRRKRGSGLSAADRLPLGKAPDLEAIIARQRLGLPLAGRLREADVSRAWKLAAADHHPDRGGRHATMQAVNMARDLLLGRGVPES